jgi:hypothetical protein
MWCCKKQLKERGKSEYSNGGAFAPPYYLKKTTKPVSRILFLLPE